MYFGFVGFRNDCVDGTTQNCMRRYTIIWKECQTQLIIIMTLVIVNGISFSCASWLTMTSFAKDVNLWLAKRTMVNNRRLANLELIFPRHLNCIFLNENPCEWHPHFKTSKHRIDTRLLFTINRLIRLGLTISRAAVSSRVQKYSFTTIFKSRLSEITCYSSAMNIYIAINNAHSALMDL